MPTRQTVKTDQQSSSKAAAHVSGNGASLPAVQVPATSEKGAVLQRIKLKYDDGKYYPENRVMGQEVESDELSREERVKAERDLSSPHLSGTLNLVRQGWRAAAQNIDPVVAAFAKHGLTDSGKKVIATRLYGASQDATGTLGQLLSAQKKWQDFLLAEGISKEAILSNHRSFGLEYEFATWEPVRRDGAVVSHTTVGETEPLSDLFGVPFVLETDAQEELELVGPPLLAGAADGSVNKAFIQGAHNLFIAFLRQFRAANEGIRVDQLPFEDRGIGSGWAWKDEARAIQVSGNRTKWADKPDQIGYQLNIALKPEEIAAEIRRVRDEALNDDHGAMYIRIRDRFLRARAYTDLTRERRAAVEPALLVLAKGISNSIAVPTLKLVAEVRTPWARGDLHSYVKDLHGLWIKDSVPNITLACVQNDVQAKSDLADILTAIRSGQDMIPRDILTGIPPYRPQGPANTREVQALIGRLDADLPASTSQLKKDAEAEAIACLDTIQSRLSEYRIVPKKNESVDFLEEDFGSGDGVRKDTYANIGRSETSSMHLAEFRSNAKTDAFLH